MKSGRPKSPAKPTAPRSAKKDAFAGVRKPLSLTDPTQPRKKSKKSLTSLLLADPRLTREDQAVIKGAAETGLDVQGIAALVAYQVCMARFFYEAGELAAKDFLVALGKAGSQAAAVAQLGATAQNAVPSKIEVSFDLAGLPTSNRLDRPAPDPQVGDIIDCE